MRWLKVHGPDAGRFLQNLGTNDVLGPGNCLTAFCDRTGRMKGVARVLKFPDHYTLAVDGGDLEAHLRRHIIMDRVELEDLTANFAAVDFVEAGALRRAGLPHELPPFGHAVHGTTLVTRFDITGAPAYQVASREPTGLERLADVEARRIANGFPRWGVDMGPDELPMEAGLTELAISYTKGCYLGQEVILRIRNFGQLPRELRLLDVEAAPGTPIQEGGRITSSAAGRSLAYVHKGFTSPGTRVTVGGRPATVRLPPFQERMRSSPA
jgi:folate-binding protein YgfZ